MASDSSPVLPDRKTMEYIERRLKEFKMQLGPMKRGPKRGPRKGGGGGSVGVVSQYAVVTNDAAAATYSGTSAGNNFSACASDLDLGKCVLLEQVDGCFQMPELGNNTLDDFKLDLRCVYEDVPLRVDYLIKVHRPGGGPIDAGPYIAEQPQVIGEYVQVTDFLRNLQGFQPEKVLWTPGNDIIEWLGGECPQ